MSSTSAVPTNCKPLIAVEGCVKQQFMMDRQARTWAVDSPIDVHFFTGPELGVKDDYWSLTEKTQAICRWSLSHGYTHTFIIDDDGYCRPERLLASGFEKHDYVGFFRDPNGTPPCAGDYPSQWISNRVMKEEFVWHDRKMNRYDVSSFMAGMGYWLSAKAMKLVADAPVMDDAEDRHVGKVLHLAGVTFHHDPRYVISFPLMGHPGPARGVYPWWHLIHVVPMAWNDIIFTCEFKDNQTVETPHKMWLDSVRRMEYLKSLVTFS